jgi:putative thiamine transport system permease protein
MARTMGYGATTAWLKAVFPLVYRQIRLPVFAVLAYAASVVDVAIVLAPSTPPPLAVQLLRWFNDPELATRFLASAGAVLQLGLVLVVFATWWLGERGVACLGRMWIRRGSRGQADGPLRYGAAGALSLSFLAAFLGLASMAVWSITGSWRFPDALPTRFSLDPWISNAPRLGEASLNTATVGLAAALVGLVLTVACLENETRFGKRVTNRALLLLYIPLLVPQIAFLFGGQILLVMSGLDGAWIAVAWAHLVFVLPYVFLSLADPYRAWDNRYARAARCLGASPMRVFCRVKLPMLLRPILVASAVGFAVSVGLYLPTLFAGAGRVDTLTTEAVALASGADRRAIGVYALAQMTLPFLAFALAAIIPASLYRNRKGLRVTA